MSIRNITWSLVMALCLIFMIGPLILVVLFSFSSNALIGFPMGEWTLSWYSKLIADEAFREAARISLIVATCVAFLSTITGTLAAFALSRTQAKWARAMLAVISVPVLLPPLVVAIAIVVLVVRGLGLALGLPVLILGHVLVTQPFVILIIMARLANFSVATVEAARDLGASQWQAFWFVTLPQIRTAVIGAALISAALSLDDFIIASFTVGGGNTLSTFVWGKIRTTLDPSINAIATILLLSTIGLSLIATRLTRYRG